MKRTLLAAILLALMAGTAFAEWSEVRPDAVYTEKTQYRFRTREITGETAGEWGSWISNGSAAIAAAADREVRTVSHSAVTQVTGYSYRRYKYRNASNGLTYYSYGSGYAQANGYGGSWQTKEVSAANRLPGYKVYDGSHQAYGTSSDFWFDEAAVTSVVAPAYTEYQYRTRTRTRTYSAWSAWSAWQDTAVASSETVEAETRTVYDADPGYLPSTILVGSVPEVPMLMGTGCQLRYANNESSLVWSSSDPEVAAVDRKGYVSAYRAGTATVSVSGASIRVVVKDWTGISLPAGLTVIEDGAFENGGFEFADLKNAEEIGDGAFAGNPHLRFVVTARSGRFAPGAFQGCGNVVVGAGVKPGDIPVPYYVIGEAAPLVQVSGVTLSSTSLTLGIGRTAALAATVSPSDAMSRTIRWSSSDTSVAAVSGTGVITGVAEGTATIQASAPNGVSAACAVTVTPVRVASITLSPASVSVVKNASAALTAAVSPSDAADRSIVWSSSDTRVATVTSDGVVKGVAPGSAAVTAAAADGSGVKAVCTVTVTADTVVSDSGFTSIAAESVTQTDATIRFRFNVSPNPTEGGILFGTSPSGLTLLKNEYYTGLSYTVNNVFFNLNKYYGTLSADTTYWYQVYYVHNSTKYMSQAKSFRTLPGITISPAGGSFEVGENETRQLSVTANVSGAAVTWSSSDTGIATVNGSGLVRGIRGGTVTITATASYAGSSAAARFTVTVNPIVYRLVLDINYQYTKEQILSGYDLEQAELYEYTLQHPFLGFLKGNLIAREWHPSPAKVNDGSAIAALYRPFVRDRGQSMSDVHYMSDARKAAVLDSVQSVFGASDYNDVNIFFYGGHGSDTAELFLQSGEHISPIELVSRFRGIQGHNLLIISSCFSGGFAGTMSSYPYASGAVFAACTAQQYSWSASFDSVECSLDVYYFLKGLGFDEPSGQKLASMPADANRDGKVTIAEIASYMHRYVRKTEGDPQTFVSSCPGADANTVIYSR